jgi:hypothetical protein
MPIIYPGLRLDYKVATQPSSCRFSFVARPSRPRPPSSKDSDCIDCSSPEKTDTKNCLRCGISDWLRRLHIDEAESFHTRLDDGGVSQFVTPLTLQTLSRHPVTNQHLRQKMSWHPGRSELADNADLV